MSDRDELIAKARKLSADVTTGPWIYKAGDVLTEQGVMIAPDLYRGVQSLRDGRFIAESRTLLPALADLAESLIADQKEYNAESIRHHCEWMNKRAEFYAIIERVSKERDAARAEVERMKERDAQTVADGLAVLNKLTDVRCVLEKMREALSREEAAHLATLAELDEASAKAAALAQENARLINEVGTLDATAREQRQRAEVLARGIAAYRSGSFTLAQVWENEEGKAVT